MDHAKNEGSEGAPGKWNELPDLGCEFISVAFHVMASFDESYSSFREREFHHPWNGTLRDQEKTSANKQELSSGLRRYARL
jgi:hypothetical protein